VIINEYGWLWLNRDGSPTELTREVYASAFPEDSTTEQRRETYARHLGILTEYWRVHRRSAAVMHFCGLGYSRSDPPLGATSDNFTNVGNLEFDPYFYTYVQPAFNPLGLMVEMWERTLDPGAHIDVPVHLINDRYEVWSDSLLLLITSGDRVISRQQVMCQVGGLEKIVMEFRIQAPKERGNYELTAQISDHGISIRSIREIEIH